MRQNISLTSAGYMSASDEIKPYTSSEESRFFNGAATRLAIRDFDLSLFFSKNYADATLASYRELQMIISNHSTRQGYIILILFLIKRIMSPCWFMDLIFPIRLII